MVGVCKVEIREQRTSGVLLPGRRGLYSFYVEAIEEVDYKAGFCNHICIREGMYQIVISVVFSWRGW